MERSTDKHAAESRLLDFLVPENMTDRETFRTKMETLLLAGKLDHLPLHIVVSEPLNRKDDIHFSLVGEKDNKYTYRITVADLLKL